MGEITFERILKWKLLPRLMMLMFTLMAWSVCDWFMSLGAEATTQQTPRSSVKWSPVSMVALLVTTKRSMLPQ